MEHNKPALESAIKPFTFYVFSQGLHSWNALRKSKCNCRHDMMFATTQFWEHFNGMFSILLTISKSKSNVKGRFVFITHLRFLKYYSITHDNCITSNNQMRNTSIFPKRYCNLFSQITGYIVVEIRIRILRLGLYDKHFPLRSRPGRGRHPSWESQKM